MQKQFVLWNLFPLRLPRKSPNTPRIFLPIRTPTRLPSIKAQPSPRPRLTNRGARLTCDPLTHLVTRGITTPLAQAFESEKLKPPNGVDAKAKQLQQLGAWGTCPAARLLLFLSAYILVWPHSSCRIANFNRNRVLCLRVIPVLRPILHIPVLSLPWCLPTPLLPRLLLTLLSINIRRKLAQNFLRRTPDR